jgi:hypothetical protein
MWKLLYQISQINRYHISEELAASRFRTEKLGFPIGGVTFSGSPYEITPHLWF